MKFFKEGSGELTNKMAEKALGCKPNHEAPLFY